MRQVCVIAHRGASAYAPENTLPAFDLALTQGADAIETDVRCTRDGIPVLCHDAIVDRVSNGQGEVVAYTLNELLKLDFGGWFSERFVGQRIVTLHAFLERYGPCCPLVLEIKQADIHDVVSSLVATMGFSSRVVFTSFQLLWLLQLRDVAPWARVGYLTRAFDEAVIEEARRWQLEQICPPASELTHSLVEKAHMMGLNVRAWGIHSDELQEHALQMGVDGMTTNWPDRLVARLVALGWRQARSV